ncbi:MAG: glucose 1-dehydrogenase [Calditrichia bacterium]
MNDLLKGKTALITGASSGIGMATAKLFSENGASLMITGRSEPALTDLAANLKNENCDVAAGDIARAEFRSSLVDKTIQRFNRLDILVNSAGIISSGSIENTSPDSFDELMNLNVHAVFHLMQLCIPHLKPAKGNIVNVSSVAGLRAFPNLLSYSVSKAAVDQLTRAAALDLGSSGIRVNSVNPGVVVTNLHRRSGMEETAYQQFLEHSKTTHPIGRVGQPEEIAELILFLSSDKAGWITGGNFPIDGGRHQTCAR